MSRIQDAIEDAFRDGVNSAKAAGALPPMSIRDWFAGQALSAVIGGAGEYLQKTGNEIVPASAAREILCDIAYRFADTMLKERAK